MQRYLGRIYKQTRRRLIAGAGEPVPFSELLASSYPRTIELKHWHRWSVYRVLKRIGVSAGRRGLWRPNDELMRLIRGE